jgi:hypothetical protein
MEYSMRRYLTVFLTGLALVLCHDMTLASTPQLWFNPGDDLEVGGVVAHPDFPELFEDPSSWPTGLAHVDVMQIRAAYFARKPKESARFGSYLKAHHIQVAGALNVMPSETCGKGVEGIMDHKGIDFYPRVIKNAGVQLDYVLMDEPLYYGHDYSARNACQLPIEAIAAGVAESVKTISAYHPNAKFILVEPEQSLSGGPAELAKFLDAYKAAVHEYPASVRFDILWHKDWSHELPPFIAMLKNRNIGYGVIYNAMQAPKDDRAWIESAKQNVQSFRQAIHTQPDHVMIQTWNPNPARIVPESDPSAMTGYLKWYVQHSELWPR